MGRDWLSAESLEREFKSSLDQLREFGFTSVRGWATPGGTLNKSYLPELQKYYDYGFTVSIGYLEPYAYRKSYNTLDDSVYELRYVSMENNGVDSIKLAIDETVKNTGILIFSKYSYSPNNGMLNEIKEILAYVAGYIEKGECIVTNTSSGVDYYYQIGTSGKDAAAETAPS